MAKRKRKKPEEEALIHRGGDVELEAVSLCLKDKKAVDYLLERNFNTKLLGEYHREMQFIIDHRLKYNKLPSIKTFTLEFPNIELRKSGETVQYYYDAFRRMYEERETVSFIEKAEMSLQNDHFVEIRRQAVSFIDRFNTVYSPTTGKTTAESLPDYESKYRDTTMGVPYPWPTITKATRGKHPGNFIMYTGISKAGKTFTAMEDCTQAYDLHGQNVLCVPLEMSEYEMQTRHYACLVDAHYTKWTRKEYTPRELKAIFRALENKLKKKKNWFRFESPAASSEFTGSYNMNWIKYLVKKHDPDLLWIDGLYLLEANTPIDHGGWRDLQQNSRAMKNFMLETNKIGVATVQMGRGSMGKKKKGYKPQDKDIGGTVSYLQDPDIVFALNRSEELRLGGQNQLISIVARECPIVSVTFNWHLNEMNFDQTIGEIEGEETLQAIEQANKSDDEVDF